MADAGTGGRAARPGEPGPSEWLAVLRRVAEQSGAFRDPAFADRYARLRLDVRGLVSAQALLDIPAGAQRPFLALVRAETRLRIAELAVEAAGDRAALAGAAGNFSADVAAEFLAACAAATEAGAPDALRDELAAVLFGPAAATGSPPDPSGDGRSFPRSA